MVAPERGSVVLVRFPFSDLSAAKLRPALVLGAAGRGDWILCQITSNAYGDEDAVEIGANDFARGSLRIRSYARPGKLFTANQTLIVTAIGELRTAAVDAVTSAIVRLVHPQA